jgi:hypothetical protein
VGDRGWWRKWPRGDDAERVGAVLGPDRVDELAWWAVPFRAGRWGEEGVEQDTFRARTCVFPHGRCRPARPAGRPAATTAARATARRHRVGDRSALRRPTGLADHAAWRGGVEGGRCARACPRGGRHGVSPPARPPRGCAARRPVDRPARTGGTRPHRGSPSQPISGEPQTGRDRSPTTPSSPPVPIRGPAGRERGTTATRSVVRLARGSFSASSPAQRTP